MNAVIVGNLLKAVVVPAATAAVELTQWHWLAADLWLALLPKILLRKKKDRTWRGYHMRDHTMKEHTTKDQEEIGKMRRF